MEFPGLTDAYDADHVGELISDMREHGYEFDIMSNRSKDCHFYEN